MKWLALDTMIWAPNVVSYFRLSDTHLKFLEHLDSETINEPYVTNNPIYRDLLSSGIISAINTPDPPLQESFAPKITAFRIVVTEACNFSCPGCFSTTSLKENGVKLRSMKRATLEIVMNKIINYGKKNELILHFFGGEPLLRMDLINIAVTICEEAVARGDMIPPKYGVTTNGSIITEEITDFLCRHRFRVGVSIEETTSVHNLIRVSAKGHKPTFDVVSANYLSLVNAGVDVHVLVTPQPPIECQFVESFSRIMEMFPMKSITINTPYNLNSLEWNTPKNYFDILIECHRRAKNLGVEVDSALTPCISAIAYGLSRRSPQSRLADIVTVGVDTAGRIVRSTHKWDEKLGTHQWEEFNVKVNRDQECLACQARGLCGGPNEEFQSFTGKMLDRNKCHFYKSLPGGISRNLDLFEQD